MKRRHFLAWHLGSAACLAAGVWPAGLALAGSGPYIAAAKGEPAQAGQAARAAVGLLGGMGRFVKKGDKVVVKPNMSFAHPPERATTTHPALVREIVLMCQEAGASQVLVLDHPLRAAERCLEESGIEEACRPLGRGLVQGVDKPAYFTQADIPQGKEMQSNSFITQSLEADVLIAAPVAKSHGSAGVSLSMKGMMGLIWDRGVMHYRYDLHEAIVDLNTKMRANLAVIDGTRVLTTNGPSGPGKVVQANTVIASADVVAADAFAVQSFEWWGQRMQPDQVKHLRLAAERGLGRIDLENLATAWA